MLARLNNIVRANLCLKDRTLSLLDTTVEEGMGQGMGQVLVEGMGQVLSRRRGVAGVGVRFRLWRTLDYRPADCTSFFPIRICSHTGLPNSPVTFPLCLYALRPCLPQSWPGRPITGLDYCKGPKKMGTANSLHPSPKLDVMCLYSTR